MITQPDLLFGYGSGDSRIFPDPQITALLPTSLNRNSSLNGLTDSFTSIGVLNNIYHASLGGRRF